MANRTLNYHQEKWPMPEKELLSFMT